MDKFFLGVLLTTLIAILLIQFSPPKQDQVKSLHQLSYHTIKEYIFVHDNVLSVYVRPQGEWDNVFSMEILLSYNYSPGEVEALSNHMLVNVNVHWQMEWNCKPIEVFDSENMVWVTAMSNGVMISQHYPI